MRRYYTPTMLLLSIAAVLMLASMRTPPAAPALAYPPYPQGGTATPTVTLMPTKTPTPPPRVITPQPATPPPNPTDIVPVVWLQYLPWIER